MALSSNNLFASIDMGTNSFKLVIIQANQSGKFLTIDRHKSPVCLGRDFSSSISADSLLRALQCLQNFHQILKSNSISPLRTRCVATAALREADNAIELRNAIHESTGLNVVVLSGEEEARYIYLGVLQFLPVFEKRVLVVDIGGGSTEFVIGEKGNVVLGVSLKIGHVGLSQKFLNVSETRDCVRAVIKDSGLVDKVKDCGFEEVVGTSGTIKAVEKAVFLGYGHNSGHDHEVPFGDFKRDWKFSKGELSSVVDKLCIDGEIERGRREEFFKGRSEFIIAGAVLLEEIFELLEIEEMEVSGYALGEGVIAETLADLFQLNNFNANARWRSVLRLATRFSDKKRITSASQCAGIAHEIFYGLRKWMDVDEGEDRINLHLDDKDLEYLQAACLLHNIGLCAGKKGYHKQTYRIIANGDFLHGYSSEEIKLIALLARHHRKKFPKYDHSTLSEISVETEKRFGILCVIIRISVVLQRNYHSNFKDMKVLHSDEGFKLALREANNESGFRAGEDMEKALRKELAHFKTVFQHPLSVEVLPCIEDMCER